MADRFRDKLAHAWNAFQSPEEDRLISPSNLGAQYGTQYGLRPDRLRLSSSSEKSFTTSIYNRISIDAAAISMVHARLDDNDNFLETIGSGLHGCLTVEANIDQGGSQFRQDAVQSLLEQGTIAIVPVDTSSNPSLTTGFEIRSLRVAEVVGWYPRHVRLSLYNDRLGRREEIVMEKKNVAIVENPLYSVMNEPNSMLQRLSRKLHLLDAIDEQSSSGKLDIIVQLPYTVKTETKREQAKERRSDIEMQLKGSKYGIAYIDSTEKVTQLNRPAENNMLAQVEFLTTTLYGQLGITKEVFEGNASEDVMLNYYNRTIEPILRAITEAMTRSFLTKTARTQHHSITYFRDPFKLVPVGKMAEIADKFTRNEILSSNELRGVIGFRPSKDPKADELRNSNMPIAKQPPPLDVGELEATREPNDFE
jgi:hypothetical protein